MMPDSLIRKARSVSLRAPVPAGAGGVAFCETSAVLIAPPPLTRPRPRPRPRPGLAGGGGEDLLLRGLRVRELGHQPSLPHDQDPVADPQHLRQLRGDHQHAHPVARELDEQVMHFGLGGHVDAPGGLVHDQHRGLAAQPLGQHDLLLVAAGEHGHRVLEPAVLDREPGRPVGGQRALGRGPDEPAAPQPPQRGQRHVLLHRHVHDQPLLAPVLGHEPHPGGHRPGGRAAPEPLPAHRDRARVVPVDAEDRPGHLAAPGADQPGQRDDLAGPDGEGDVGEHALAGEPVHGEQRLARRDLLARRPFGQFPADHRPDQVARDQARRAPG